MTFFAAHRIPAANPVNEVESVNLFTSILSDILFRKQKEINPSALLLQEPVVVCFAAFHFAVFEFVVVVN